MKNFLEKLTPYLIAGISIVLFIAMLIVLSYVLIWGLVIGLIMFAFVYIKQRFFPSKKPKPTTGRIIDQDGNEVHQDNHE